MGKCAALLVAFLSIATTAAAQPGAAPPGPASPPSPGDPGSAPLFSVAREAASDRKLDAFLSAVKADSFWVTEGKLFMPDVTRLVCAGYTASCNGNNNTNPYLAASVPEPGLIVDPLLPAPNFTLRQDEAIVLVGRTPPPAAYFSFRSFIFNHWVERESVRRKIFTSLGDPHNMMTLSTKGKDPYDKPFVLLVASDAGTQARVRKALALAGYADGIITEDVISPNMARMSSKENGDTDPEKDDDFIFVARIALWEYGFEAAGAAYLADPPVAVLRLTPLPRTPKADYKPLPVEKLRPRGTGSTELDFAPEVTLLRDAIKARYPGMKADDLRPTTWLEESFVAIQKDLDVVGESRDTVYLRNEGTFSLADDEFAVVYGVNHERSGKATYAAFAVYDACRDCPYAGENSRRVAGSALDYFPDPKKQPLHVDSLYAWKIARNCHGEPRCSEVPAGECTEGIAAKGQMFVGFRAYVEPATKIGPAFSEIVYDRVLRFTPNAPEIADVSFSPPEVAQAGKGVDHGTPVDIRFKVVVADGQTTTWKATLKTEDGCGELTPATGTVTSTGEVTTHLTVPEKQRTTLTLYLDATSASGRRAKTYGARLRFK